MAARVLHFGYDDCHRVQVLRHAGYSVTESPTLTALDRDLQAGESVDAVILSEETPRSAEEAVEIVRSRSAAPVILFRRSNRNLDERRFDHVFSWFISPQVWLMTTADLIAQSQATRQRSSALRLESRAVREETERQLQRSREELDPTSPPLKDHKYNPSR